MHRIVIQIFLGIVFMILKGDNFMSNIKNTSILFNDEIREIKNLLEQSKKTVATTVNTTLLVTNWKIGEIIVKYEQNNNIRAAYGESTLKEMSKVLSKEFGTGFSRSNLQNMRKFYLEYTICQAVTGKLTWTHYCELLSITDYSKRSFYEKECVSSNWSTRELKRQINTSFYERLLLSNENINKEVIYKLATKGNEVLKAEDIIKDPYVFEFLGIPENKPLMESDL